MASNWSFDDKHQSSDSKVELSSDWGNAERRLPKVSIVR